MGQRDKVLSLGKRQGIFRTREALEQGITGATLSRLVESGELERLGRGLYSLKNTDISEHHTLAVVSKRVDGSVICLLSALAFHGMTTQMPASVWTAIATGRTEPHLDYPELEVVFMSPVSLEFGAEIQCVDQVPVRITSPAKTVADCFKYRNKVGLDVCLEALRDFWTQRRQPVAELWRAAEVCRVTNVMKPYLEATLG